MIVAICFFLVGAGFGGFLAIRHFLRRNMIGWVAIAHGVAGATGFGTLLLWCIREPGFAPVRYALGILLGAVALGCVNVVFHLRRVRHRSTLIVAHALVAVLGVGTLTYAAFTHGSAMAAEETAPIAAPPSSASASTFGSPPDTRSALASPEAPSAERPRPAMPLGLAWPERTVSFRKSTAVPDEGSLGAIEAVAGALAADPRIELVEVQGHSDERGGDGQNLELTRSRANAVVEQLVERGVARGRLRATGLGARCPFDPSCAGHDAPPGCHHEEAWEKDRRVTFVVLESAGARLQGTAACPRAADSTGASDNASPAGK